MRRVRAWGVGGGKALVLVTVGFFVFGVGLGAPGCGLVAMDDVRLDSFQGVSCGVGDGWAGGQSR
jgi:hypothetical protein